MDDMVLKFGSFVAKIFQNLFVQMPDTIFMANQNFTIHFLRRSHKSTVSITTLSQCTTNHLLILFNPLFVFVFQDPAQLVHTIETPLPVITETADDSHLQT